MDKGKKMYHVNGNDMLNNGDRPMNISKKFNVDIRIISDIKRKIKNHLDHVIN